jgi:hypothetical protein
MNLTPDPTISYIGGCMRSGSTLLDRVLSLVPGFVSAGEIVHLWERGVRQNELCGCGVRFLECPFWTRVGDVAFGGWDALDIDGVIELQRSVDRTRYIPLMLTAPDGAAYARKLRRYSDLLLRLYRGIGAVSGGCVIVDSSKHASTAFLLRRVEGIKLVVVHLVRDSHGVTYSLMKKVPRPEVTSAGAYMPMATPLRAGVEWLSINTLFHLLRGLGTLTTLVRYESFVTEAEVQIRRILGALGREEAPGDLDFVGDGVVRLREDHTVSGNPMRFVVGELDLQVDDTWRRAMPTADRVVTTALTWPLLMRYGYIPRGRK